jgi:hypothetical protein
MMNGRPVPGEKGSCPTGSTWSETAGDGEFQFADVGDFLKRRYTDKDTGDLRAGTAAMDALIFVPGVGWMARGAMTAGKVGTTGIGKLISALTRTKTPAVPAVNTTRINRSQLAPQGRAIENRFPINNPVPRINNATPFRPYVPTTTVQTKAAIPAGTKFSLPKTSLVAGTGLAINEQFNPLTEAGKENKRLRDEKASELKTQIANRDAELQNQANLEADKAEAERQRVANLGFFDRMKEPGYWDKSISGFSGDNRLNRLGQLLYFYGLPPSGRAKAKNPAETWAKMSSDAATLAAKNAGDSAFSKIGDKTLKGSIADLVKSDYGNTWMPFDVMFGDKLGKEDLEAVTQRIAVLINQISRQPGMSTMSLQQLYELAKVEYEKERNA